MAEILRIVGDKDYYVEISNDEDTFYIRVGTFDNYRSGDRRVPQVDQRRARDAGNNAKAGTRL